MGGGSSSAGASHRRTLYLAEPGHSPLWSQSCTLILWVPVLSRALASHMQLYPPGTFLSKFVELQNLKVSAQRSRLLEAFLGSSSEQLSSQRHPLKVLITPVIPSPTKEMRPEGRGQGLLLSLCQGSDRGSLERLGGSGQLEVGTEPRGGGWRLDPALSGSYPFNSCWPGPAWAPALPPVQL